MKEARDELEKYKKLLDDTLKKLDRVHQLQKGKINPFLAALGILVLAIGGVIIVVAASADFNNNSEMITPLGILSVFIGLCVVFTGYIIAHKGLKGTWL